MKVARVNKASGAGVILAPPAAGRKIEVWDWMIWAIAGGTFRFQDSAGTDVYGTAAAPVALPIGPHIRAGRDYNVPVFTLGAGLGLNMNPSQSLVIAVWYEDVKA